MDEMDVLNRAEEMVAALLDWLREDPQLGRYWAREGLMKRVEDLAVLLATHAEPKT